jgi:hypothetical protein
MVLLGAGVSTRSVVPGCVFPSDSFVPRLVVSQHLAFPFLLVELGSSLVPGHWTRGRITKTTHPGEGRNGYGILDGNLAPQLCFPVSFPVN